MARPNWVICLKGNNAATYKDVWTKWIVRRLRASYCKEPLAHLGLDGAREEQSFGPPTRALAFRGRMQPVQVLWQGGTGKNNTLMLLSSAF